MIQKLRYIFNRKDKIKIFFLMIMIIIGSFLQLLGVTAFMPFIEIVMEPGKIFETEITAMVYQRLNLSSTDVFLAIMAVAIIGVYIIKNIYLSILQNSILKFSYRTRMNLAVRLLTTYMHEPYIFHLGKNIAELQRSLQVDTNQFMMLVNNTLQIIAEAMVCIVIGLYLFDTSHSITGAVLGLMAVCLGLFLFISKKVSTKLGEENQRYNALLFQWINQSLGGIKEVKVLQREEFFIDSYRKNYKKLIRGARINELLSAVPRYIMEAVCITGLLVAVIIKMFFGFAGKEVSDFIPQLAVFAVASFQLLPAIGKMNAFANSIMYCLPSLDMIYNDLREIEKMPENLQPAKREGKKRTFQNGIHVEHVTYQYPGAERPVLKDVDINIPIGSTVALIGASGAGKTTLADIILGLLPPCEGRIMADDMNVYDDLAEWHRHLGYIPQSIYLSDDTIRNNIAFGIPEAEIDEKKIKAALEKAQLTEFVDSLEKGADTFVGDRGVRLSGGQRQRIGIARALYHDPDILVLDEATSALDNETEQAVMEAIESLQGTKTMIIIAHRLTTIRNADAIYEIGEGIAVKREKDEVIKEG